MATIRLPDCFRFIGARREAVVSLDGRVGNPEGSADDALGMRRPANASPLLERKDWGIVDRPTTTMATSTTTTRRRSTTRSCLKETAGRNRGRETKKRKKTGVRARVHWSGWAERFSSYDAAAHKVLYWAKGPRVRRRRGADAQRTTSGRLGRRRRARPERSRRRRAKPAAIRTEARSILPAARIQRRSQARRLPARIRQGSGGRDRWNSSQARRRRKAGFFKPLWVGILAFKKARSSSGWSAVGAALKRLFDRQAPPALGSQEQS